MKTYLSGLASNLALAFQITFVANQKTTHVARGKFINILEPSTHTVERFDVRNVVHNDDTVRASVVGFANRPEPFLASRIPLWCGTINGGENAPNHFEREHGWGTAPYRGRKKGGSIAQTTSIAQMGERKA